MIGIRVDANNIISTGHVMRCIAIEQGIHSLQESVIFFVADETGRSFLETKGYDSICLGTDWTQKEEELPILIEHIKRYKIDKLIIDSYQVTKNYLDTLCQWTKVIYIDDLKKEKYKADMLINYGLNISETDYAQYKEESLKLLLGRAFVPLRKEFQNRKIVFHEAVTDILVTTGGSDSFFIIEKLMNQIQKQKSLADIRFHIIVGKFFTNSLMLKKLVQNKPNLILYHDVMDMSEIMLKCDLAISAGGTTLSELSALGIPTICFAIADNQLVGIEAFWQAGVMIYAGDVREQGENAPCNILSELKYLIEDSSKRKNMYTKAKDFIDGNGAIRIAKEVIKL